MYCTCSNKNNYEVIGLCDVTKFTKNLGPFDGRPWTEITVPAISILDCNNAAIEAIQKIYVHVSITSTKIIDTPKSPLANSEGLSLTGKKLLIDGFICENIVYTELTPSQNINTILFNIPFCTFIVIEGNTDIFNDTYCVKYCIEDVFVNLIDCKTLFQNITLFLFAQKSSLTCPSIQPPKDDCTINVVVPIPPVINKLKNSIIINNNSNTSVEVAKIEFDTDNEELMVDSSGIIADSSSTDTYFSFKLKDTNNLNVLYSSNIRANENANTFENTLNNEQFQYGNILELNYSHPSKVSITNFPNEGQIHIPNVNVEYFKITLEGLIAYNPPSPILNKLPNIITTVNRGGGDIGPVVQIEFDKDNERLIVSSTGRIPDQTAGSNIYFSLTLKDSNNTVIKNSYNILSNENAEKFKNILNGQSFQYNDILEIYYDVPNLGTITNFPSQGNTYHPTNKTEFYKITPTGLVTYTPIVVPVDLTNTIVVRSRQGTISTIKFDSTNKQLIVDSSKAIPNSTIRDVDYFSFKLKDSSNRTIKANSNILTNENSEKFKNALNGQSFELNDILELYYLDNTQILILDYPQKPERYTPKNNKEYYRITATGLVPYTLPVPLPTSLTLPNEIIINSNTTQEVSRILFDITNNVLLVNITYKTPYVTAGNQPYITVKLKDKNTQSTRKSVSFLSNANGEDFFNNLNNSPFTIGNFLEVYYFIPQLSNVTNYPNRGENHIPTKQIEYYEITATGLVPYTPPTPIKPPTVATLPNTIKIKADNGNNVAVIQFDSGNKRFIINTTTEIPKYSEGIKEYFILKLRNGSSKEIKTYSFITANADGGNLGFDLNDFPFEFGDVIDMYYFNPNSIEISDIPSKGKMHIPTNTKERYTLTTNGLELLTNDLNSPLSNIVVNSKTDEELVTIQFGNNGKFIATATGNIPDTNPSAINTEYFAFSSQKISGLINFTSKFNSGELADTFAREVNDKDFSDLDYLSLSYADKSKIQISNFEGQSLYTPNEYSKQLLINNRPIINNSFRLQNIMLLVNSNDEVIATIQFNILTKKLIVLSTNKTTTNADFWIIGLIDSFKNPITSFTIEQNKTGDNFAKQFNGRNFDYGYYIYISVHNKRVSTLTITNFSNKIVNNLPPIDSDISIYTFKITSSGLIEANL